MKNIFATFLLLAMPCLAQAQLKYDEKAPEYHLPRLEREAHDYNPDDKSTYAVYTDVHTVADPNKAQPKVFSSNNGTLYAIWCTRGATYLAQFFYTQNAKNYYISNTNGFLEDCDTGKRYRQTDNRSFPMGGEHFWVHTLGMEWFCFMEVYEPLPETCTKINIGDQRLTPEGWEPRIYTSNVEVAKLQANQHIAKYQKAVVVY